MSSSLPPRPKLLAQVRAACRLRPLSRRTAQAYLSWVRRFVRFHRLRHPVEMREPEVLAFVSELSTVQEFLGHSDVSTTMVYTHVLNRDGLGVRSPADLLVGDPE